LLDGGPASKRQPAVSACLGERTNSEPEKEGVAGRIAANEEELAALRTRVVCEEKPGDTGHCEGSERKPGKPRMNEIAGEPKRHECDAEQYEERSSRSADPSDSSRDLGGLGQLLPPSNGWRLSCGRPVYH